MLKKVVNVVLASLRGSTYGLGKEIVSASSGWAGKKHPPGLGG
jgi:hypothetical protein